MNEKKAYFRNPTVGEIKRSCSVTEISDHFVDKILALQENEAVIIGDNLIPKNYWDARQFGRRGKSVELPGCNMQEALKTEYLFQEQRRAAFNTISARRYSSYFIDPKNFNTDSRDLRIRKITLVDCLEGARIYGYVHREWPKDSAISTFDVGKIYTITDNNERGVEVNVKVPSRTLGHQRWKVKYVRVPIKNNTSRVALMLQLNARHMCEDKRNRIGESVGPDMSDVVVFCPHDIAGYLALADHFQEQENKDILHRLNPFAMPTQLTVDYYLKLERNCLIKYIEEKNGKKKEKLRTLIDKEKDIMLWGLGHIKKYDLTFSAEDVKDLTW
ncbi:MAG: hypothetical protein KJ597_06800 [Nanoarchaeota archaeon]|nr:hypothetical protein [Nanoarchaeota archaeon]MBU1623256.1 hypothetical protein [Nanoarchaeota archaeon]